MKKQELTETDIISLIKLEEASALQFNDELGLKRKKLLDYYHCMPLGNEVDEQSQAVTSDVADVVENATTYLYHQFTQGKKICYVESDLPEYDREAYQKEMMANFVFNKCNGKEKLLTAIKDAILQYTGVMKVFYNISTDLIREKYKGMSQAELQKIMYSDDEMNVINTVENEDGTFDLELDRKVVNGKIDIENIAPEDFLIATNAKDFNKPRFIGQRTLKTRSQLVAMGFDYEEVYKLPKETTNTREQYKSSYYQSQNQTGNNPSNHDANDSVYLGEYYCYIDIDGDGHAELWQLFISNGVLLGKERVNVHPYAVLIPIILPHYAIGTCPAEQVADLQMRHSVLTRQFLNNIYNINWSRLAYNDRVDQDDLLNVKSGGTVYVEGDDAVAGAIGSVGSTVPVGQEILMAIEATEVEKEVRTGVNRISQGIDGSTLNKTATAFVGLSNKSDARLDLIARTLSIGIETLFEKLIQLISQIQTEKQQIRILGEQLEVDPTSWEYGTSCRIDVGISASDKIEQISNLNTIINKQEIMMQSGSPMVDPSTYYTTLDKLCMLTGLNGAKGFFLDPSKPEDQVINENAQLQAANAQLQQQVQELQQQLQNPLVEVQNAKTQGQLAIDQQSAQTEAQLEQIKQQNRIELENIKIKGDLASTVLHNNTK